MKYKKLNYNEWMNFYLTYTDGNTKPFFQVDDFLMFSNTNEGWNFAYIDENDGYIVPIHHTYGMPLNLSYKDMLDNHWNESIKQQILKIERMD